jgi:Ca2+-binding EF-hand superfamily protein
MKWMELADRDGNGELDIKEFNEFFSKLEGCMISDDEIQAIFDDFDGSGNKMLSVEEFARAIYQVVLSEQEDPE